MHFLVDFDLILVYVPLMCTVANCTFSLMGRTLLTMAYSAVFNHVSCLQLLLRIKFHPLHFQMGCTISCFSLQDCDLKIVFKLKNEEKREIIRTFVKKFAINGNEEQCKQA